MRESTVFQAELLVTMILILTNLSKMRPRVFESPSKTLSVLHRKLQRFKLS